MSTRWSVSIGRVAGVRIRIHASFLLLVLLVFWVGATTTLGGALAELVWIVVVFACVVVHELAHSVVATRLGIRVKDIVLLPIGGVSEMDRIPDDPRRELAISGAGPAASLGLAVGALLASGLMGQHWWPPGLFAGPDLARLGWLNALLAGFNLLPVLPMDGGRLLRAALEPRMGSYESTLAAARIGRVGAALLIVGGLFYDLWLTFIGVFVLLGANLEGANARAHQALSGHRVAEAMIPSAWTVDEQLLVGRSELEQAIRRQGVLPVTSADKYVGALGPPELGRLAQPVAAGRVADRDAPSLSAEEPLDHVLDALQQSRQSAVTVIAGDGRVVGTVTLEGINQILRSTARSGTRI